MSDVEDTPARPVRHDDDDDDLVPVQQEEEAASPPPAKDDDESDSELSEVDEELLDNDELDAEIRQVNEQAAAASRTILDEDAVRKLGVHRRAVVDRTKEPQSQRIKARGRKRGRNIEEEEDAEGVTIEDDGAGKKSRARKEREVTPLDDLPEEEREHKHEHRYTQFCLTSLQARDVSLTRKSMKPSSPRRNVARSAMSMISRRCTTSRCTNFVPE